MPPATPCFPFLSLVLHLIFFVDSTSTTVSPKRLMAAHSFTPSVHLRHKPGPPLPPGHLIVGAVAGCQVPGTPTWSPSPSIPDQNTPTDVPFLGIQKCASSPLAPLLDSTGTVSAMSTNGACPMPAHVGGSPCHNCLLNDVPVGRHYLLLCRFASLFSYPVQSLRANPQPRAMPSLYV